MDKEEIKKLAILSRLKLTDDEIDARAQELGSILDYIEKIKEAGTADDKSRVESAIVRNVMRDDSNPHESGFHTDDLINEAPDTKDNYIKVRKIL